MSALHPTPIHLRRLREEKNLAPFIRLLHVSTLAVILPERPQIRGLAIALIVGSHDAPDGFRGLGSVVEGDARGMVMQHVCLDGAVEEMAADEAKVPVDGGCRAPEEGPSGGRVVG